MEWWQECVPLSPQQSSADFDLFQFKQLMSLLYTPRLSLLHISAIQSRFSILAVRPFRPTHKKFYWRHVKDLLTIFQCSHLLNTERSGEEWRGVEGENRYLIAVQGRTEKMDYDRRIDGRYLSWPPVARREIVQPVFVYVCKTDHRILCPIDDYLLQFYVLYSNIAYRFYRKREKQSAETLHTPSTFNKVV